MRDAGPGQLSGQLGAKFIWYLRGFGALGPGLLAFDRGYLAKVLPNRGPTKPHKLRGFWAQPLAKPSKLRGFRSPFWPYLGQGYPNAENKASEAHSSHIWAKAFKMLKQKHRKMFNMELEKEKAKNR